MRVNHCGTQVGLLANCHKKVKLAQCRLALQMLQPQAATVESVRSFMLHVSQIDVLLCPQCSHEKMQMIEIIVAVKHRQIVATGPPP